MGVDSHFSAAAWAEGLLKKANVRLKLTKTPEEKLRDEGFDALKWAAEIIYLAENPAAEYMAR